MSVTSTAGDVTGTTANAGGTAAITGVGVSLGSLTAGGTALIQAVGPTATTDPVAGEVKVAQFVRGTGADTTTAPAVTIKAYDAITLPIVTASAGSISLMAGGNIAIPTLTAFTNITSTAGGTTTLTTATSGQNMSFTSGRAVLFTTLTSGGAMSVTSVGGTIIGATATAGVLQPRPRIPPSAASVSNSPTWRRRAPAALQRLVPRQSRIRLRATSLSLSPSRVPAV